MAEPTSITIESLLKEAVSLCEAALDTYLPAEDAPPARLHKAMRYAVFAGGKRIRPALALASCRACGGNDNAAFPAMAALEMLHTYTLVHDDLPAMDDDDLRRGRPTVHKAFDEATAILCGDALLTHSFGILSEAGAPSVRCLADAAGSLGVVGGQQDDLDAEGEKVEQTEDCKERLIRIHLGKTAALIRASCELGALAAGATEQQRQALADYGQAIGLAFQIRDDILDATASSEAMGKTAGKDAASGKLTYVALFGLEDAQKRANKLEQDAARALSTFGDEATALNCIGNFIVNRGH